VLADSPELARVEVKTGQANSASVLDSPLAGLSLAVVVTAAEMTAPVSVDFGPAEKVVMSGRAKAKTTERRAESLTVKVWRGGKVEEKKNSGVVMGQGSSVPPSWRHPSASGKRG
jgi:hypothetical protein